VRRLRPTWVALDVQQAAHQEHESAERISRLSTRALEIFEPALASVTRRGRPPRCAHDDDETPLLRALLEVATALLAHVSFRRPAVREIVVGAWRRLSREHGVTQPRFCSALAIPARTLRSWIARLPHSPAAVAAPIEPVVAPDPSPRPPRKRPPRRARFGFDVTLPDTQLAADTTDLRAFGVRLKLVAAQDIGGRDQDLFDAVVVDDHESAELVRDVLERALRGHAGAQALTDQGTPYMAALVADALDALDVEHAPQKEAHPQGKATIERAFSTIKSIAAPLLAITDKLALAIPALRDTVLATSVARLVVAALLRAYQHGARAARRASDARGPIDDTTLSQLAAESRERARATERSARLLLTHVHELFGISKPLRSFVDSLRRYPLTVLRDAERALSSQVHRADIHDRASYFAAIVRRLHDEHRKTLARANADAIQDARLRAQISDHEHRIAQWNANPAHWMRDALHALASHWIPARRELLFGGVGLGLKWLTLALARLSEIHGTVAARDIAQALLADFTRAQLDRLGPDGVAAIHSLVARHIDSLDANLPSAPLAASAPSAMLPIARENRRSSPSGRLRI
jgi:hypothetical protein